MIKLLNLLATIFFYGPAEAVQGRYNEWRSEKFLRDSYKRYPRTVKELQPTLWNGEEPVGYLPPPRITLPDLEK